MRTLLILGTALALASPLAGAQGPEGRMGQGMMGQGMGAQQGGAHE